MLRNGISLTLVIKIFRVLKTLTIFITSLEVF